MNLLKIKLGETEMELPDYLTWEQYMRIKKYNYENIKPIQIISGITGIDEKELKKASLKDIELVSNLLSQFYFNNPMDTEVKTTFFFEDVEYGLETNFSKLPWGVWMDLEVYSSQNVEEHIPKILALLYYPIVSRKGSKYKLAPYNEEEIEERAEAFKQVPMDIWFGASSFFLLFAKTYIEGIKSSLTIQNKVNNLKMKGMKVLPKWLQRKLLAGSILNAPKSLPKKT